MSADIASARSREEIEREQQERLRRLLDRLVPANPFWTPRLEEAGLVGGEAVDLARFSARLPLLAKSEITADQTASPPHGTNLCEAPERAVRVHQTSSTSGKAPLCWLDTSESWSWVVDNWAAVLDAAEIGARDRVFFAFSFGPFIGFWAGWDAATQRGCMALPGGALSARARLDAILAHAATVLCCTPTYAIRLGELAVEEGLDLSASPVRKLIVAGEPGGCVPASRRRLEELWPGARVFDHYGLTEIGPVTVQTPDAPEYVLPLESSYLCELIDPESTAPLEIGAAPTAGELVLTTLGRTMSPLLRYRTGDLVHAFRRPGPAGVPGRLAFAGGIKGRVDDMVVVRGVNLYPAALDQVVREVGGVAEYRVEIREERGMVELELLVEPLGGPEAGAESLRKLEEGLRQAFPLRIPLVQVRAGSLPRFELKARRWVRLHHPDDRIPDEAREPS